MIRKVNTDARRLIGEYFTQYGVVPKLVVFASLMGYRSLSSAHSVLQQLVRDRFLAKETSGKRRYIPGPLFRSRPGKTSLPRELMDALPSGDNIRALQVDENWRFGDAVCLQPGDLVLLGPPVGAGQPLEVFRRGRRYEVRHEAKRGWEREGVLIGMYRTHSCLSRVTGW